jgi:hypothetical protein
VITLKIRQRPRYSSMNNILPWVHLWLDQHQVRAAIDFWRPSPGSCRGDFACRMLCYRLPVNVS